MFNYKEFIKRIFKLAMPIVGTRLLYMIGTFITMLMLAQLGHRVLAASALIMSSQTTALVLGLSMLSATSYVAGRMFGEGEGHNMGALYQQSLVLALLLSIPSMLIYWNIKPILLLFGQSSELVTIVQQYFHAYIWTAVPLLLVFGQYQFCFGIGKQKIAVINSFLTLVVLIITAYVLIFGKFGFPKLGPAGLGYAYALSYWVSLVVFLVTLFFDKDLDKYRLFQAQFKNGWHHFTKLVEVGWPMSVQYGGELFAFFILTMMVGWLGVNSLAAYQVVSQYVMLFIVPLFGVAQSAGVLVGQSYGAKRYAEVRHIGYASIIVVIIAVMFIFVAYIGFPKQLASMYLNVNQPSNFNTVRLIKWLFVVSSFIMLFDSIRNTFAGALRGLYDTRYPMLVSILVIWIISIPLGYVFGFNFQFGVIGLRTAVTVSILLGALILWRRWHKSTALLAVSTKSE